MTYLQRLANLLANSKPSIEAALGTSNEIDPIVRQLRHHAKAGTQGRVPDDLLAAAARQFWLSRKLDSLREARLVSFGLSLPIHTDGRSLMDDRERFLAVLDAKTGVDQWIDRPRWYRRCYQGLVRSYFTYDGKAEHASKSGRQNWGDLRDYLRGNARRIVEAGSNPDWVSTTTSHEAIFGDAPCDRYADSVLSGDSSIVETVCLHLNISKASWFLRELIHAQIKEATRKDDHSFEILLPRLLNLLNSHPTLRDQGMVMVLDRYASMKQVPLNLTLRDAAVAWWGNPWLPSNESCWGGVHSETREMVSDWLKREFVETFFEKLAKDGTGDRRRAKFWLRYVKSMTDIRFALGANALSSKDKDFIALRAKMKGLYTAIVDGPVDNNAFIMTLGKLIAVEFGSGGNALYGYHAERSLPFDSAMPVRTVVNAKNSLKDDRRILKLSHTDGVHGWNKWEDRFDETLRGFFVRPIIEASLSIASEVVPPVSSNQSLPVPSENRVTPISAPPIPTTTQVTPINAPPILATSSWANCRYSKQALKIFANSNGLDLDDLSARNGNVWVRYHDNDQEVTAVLQNWGFKYKADKGWWRQP